MRHGVLKQNRLKISKIREFKQAELYYFFLKLKNLKCKIYWIPIYFLKGSIIYQIIKSFWEYQREVLQDIKRKDANDVIETLCEICYLTIFQRVSSFGNKLYEKLKWKLFVRWFNLHCIVSKVTRYEHDNNYLASNQ